MDFSVKELLEKVSTGQMILVIFLDDDYDELDTFITFENDKLDLKIPAVKRILNKNVEFISTEGEYLRIEVIDNE